MKNQIKKQEIAQLLSKFMAGETSVAEEEVLAQYFRTHEVDEEWTEYKEMFTLFDNGEVDIDIEEGTSEQPIKDDSAKIQMLPKTVREAQDSRPQMAHGWHRCKHRIALGVPSWKKHCRTAFAGGRENRSPQG